MLKLHNCGLKLSQEYRVMKANLSPFGVLIFLFSFTEQTTAQQDVCPPWFIPDNTSSTGCSCHHDDVKVICGPDFPFLHFGFCMTYSNKTGATEYGPRPYIGHYNTTTYSAGDFYFRCRVMCPHLKSSCVGH